MFELFGERGPKHPLIANHPPLKFVLLAIQPQTDADTNCKLYATCQGCVGLEAGQLPEHRSTLMGAGRSTLVLMHRTVVSSPKAKYKGDVSATIELP